MGAPTRRSLAHAAIGSAHRMRPVHRDLFASASRLAGNKLHPDRVCYWDRYRHAIAESGFGVLFWWNETASGWGSCQSHHSLAAKSLTRKRSGSWALHSKWLARLLSETGAVFMPAPQ